MSGQHVVEIENIAKTYDGVKAVDGVSLAIPSGTIYGLLGPNGAGKTTTIRMLMRIILPDTGTIRMFGQALETNLRLSRDEGIDETLVVGRFECGS